MARQCGRCQAVICEVSECPKFWRNDLDALTINRAKFAIAHEDSKPGSIETAMIRNADTAAV